MDKKVVGLAARDLAFLKNSKKRLFYVKGGKVYSFDGEGAERSVYAFVPSGDSLFSSDILENRILHSESFKEIRKTKEKGLLGIAVKRERNAFGEKLLVSHPNLRKKIEIPLSEPGMGGDYDVERVVKFVESKKRGNVFEAVFSGPYMEELLSNSVSSKYVITIKKDEEGAYRLGFPTMHGAEETIIPYECLVYVGETFPDVVSLNLSFPLSMAKSLKDEISYIRISIGKRSNGEYVEAEMEGLRAVYGR